MNDDYDNSNDSDIESRLYAEIYFANNIPEPWENIEKKSSNSSVNKCEVSRPKTPKRFTADAVDSQSSNQDGVDAQNLDHLSEGKGKSKDSSSESRAINNSPGSENLCSSQVEQSLSANQKEKTPKAKKRTSKDVNTCTENQTTCVITDNERSETKTPKRKNSHLTDNNIEGPQITPKTKTKNMSNSSVSEHVTEKGGRSEPTSESNTPKRRKVVANSGNDRDTNVDTETAIPESDKTPKTKKLNPYNSSATKQLVQMSSEQSSKNLEESSRLNKSKKRLLNSTDELVNKKNKNNNTDFQQESVSSKKSKSSKTSKTSQRNSKTRNYDSDVIIELSSDSSDNSEPDLNSKYDVITTQQKKSSSTSIANEPQDENDSDSESSIFEVPIPRKPTPPLIVVKDSENEMSDDESVPSVSSKSTECDDRINETESERNSVHLSEEESRTSVPEPQIIVNFTDVQKGVSSIAEVKRLSHSGNADECTTSTGTSQKDNRSTKNKSPGRENNKNKKNVTFEEYLFLPMSQQMKDFYNNSWGGENFDVKVLQSRMPMNPNNWAILDTDMTLSFVRRRRYFGMKCTRCHQEGHSRDTCPELPKGPLCHMCGNKGHYETRCPEKKCLTCGKKQSTYRKTCESCQNLHCHRCSSDGHTHNNCPDLWRRYHQTIHSEGISVPQNYERIMKPSYLLQCCNCTRRGHDWTSCRMLRWSQHFPTPSIVVNYTDGPHYPMTESIEDTSFCENIYPSTTQITNQPVSNNSLYKSFEDVPSTPEPIIEIEESVTQQQIVGRESHSESCKIIYEFISPNQNFSKGCITTETHLDTLKGASLNGLRQGSVLPSFVEKIIFTKVHLKVVCNQDNQLLMRLNCPQNHHDSLQHLLLSWLRRRDEDKNSIEIDPRLVKVLWIKKIRGKLNKLRNTKEDPMFACQELFHFQEKYSGCNDPHAKKKIRGLKEKLVLVLFKANLIDNSLWKIVQEALVKLAESKKRSINAETFLQFLAFTNALNPIIPFNLAEIMETYCHTLSFQWNVQMDIETNLRNFYSTSNNINIAPVTLEVITASPGRASIPCTPNYEPLRRTVVQPVTACLTKAQRRNLKLLQPMTPEQLENKRRHAFRLIKKTLVYKTPQILNCATSLEQKLISNEVLDLKHVHRLSRLLAMERKKWKASRKCGK